MPEPKQENNEGGGTQPVLEGDGGEQNPPASQEGGEPTADETQAAFTAADVREMVAQALREREEEQRTKILAEQGNFQQIAIDNEARARKAELELWRLRAAAKYKLDARFVKTLSGDTEAAITESARIARQMIDDAVKAQERVLADETTVGGGNEGGADGNKSRKAPVRADNADAEAVTRRNIGATLGMNIATTVPQRNYKK
jgi:hypothetical protein